ncbi:MAG: hypothetical protein WBQ53_04660, partial [Methylocystis sp.]
PITQRFDAQMRGYHRHSSPLRDSWRRTLTASIPERNPAAASQSAGNRINNAIEATGKSRAFLAPGVYFHIGDGRHIPTVI